MENRIRYLRNVHNLTLKQLGEAIGLADNTVSQYETGRREPDFATLLKIADYFGVTTDFILGRENTIKEEKSPAEAEDPHVLLFSQLSPENQEKAQSYLEFLLSSQDN